MGRANLKELPHLHNGVDPPSRSLFIFITILLKPITHMLTSEISLRFFKSKATYNNHNVTMTSKTQSCIFVFRNFCTEGTTSTRSTTLAETLKAGEKYSSAVVS